MSMVDGSEHLNDEEVQNVVSMRLPKGTDDPKDP